MVSQRYQKATVLVVDDQEIVKDLMARTLEAGGFNLLTANNGSEALNIFRDSPVTIDLLVTDYSMPGISGGQLARECCDLNRNLSVLFVTGSPVGNDLSADLSLTRRGYLAKPFRPKDLLLSVTAMLETGSVPAGLSAERLA